MALWALRKQGDYELPITIALNLAPALEFNEMNQEEFYSEKEQQSRIIRDLKIFGATQAELGRVRFDMSTQNPKYLDLVHSIKSGDVWAFPLYKKLLDAFEGNVKFAQDIRRCIPEQVKTGGQWSPSFHYALIEIHEIIEAYKKGQKIKIGYERERLYDQVFVSILNGEYEDLLDITKELNSQYDQEGGLKWNQLFWSVYWSKKADHNSMRLREKLIGKKRLTQVLYATPLVVLAIVWWEYHRYEIDQTREQAYKEALWDQGMSTSKEFSALQELNKQAKQFDYVMSISTMSWFHIGYEWKDVKIKAMEEIGMSVALSIEGYVHEGEDLQDVGKLKDYTSSKRHIMRRWISLEIMNILEEERFEKYALGYDFDSGWLSSEFYDDMTKDPRFAKIFELYTLEKWQDTPEFKKKVFYWYGK